MIIRGGENIYPREIEEVLYTHPGVLECAVIGVPDEIRGEEVLAVLAPKPGAELDEEAAQSLGGRAPRGVQSPQKIRDPRRTPENPDRQDQQAPPARRIRPLGTHQREAISGDAQLPWIIQLGRGMIGGAARPVPSVRGA